MIGKKFPKLVSYKILVIAITLLLLYQILNGFLNEGVFWGIITIAMTILGLGIMYYIEYRKRGNDFDDMFDFLEKMVLSQVDEKITVLHTYSSQVPDWVSKGNEFIHYITNRIASDITAISRFRNDISDEQKIAINEQLIRLTTAMRNNNLDSVKIEAVRQLLNQDLIISSHYNYISLFRQLSSITNDLYLQYHKYYLLYSFLELLGILYNC